ncbi:MAG: hypothetical protein AB7G12_10365 [Thermoanaerobaculia bacterium]
MRHPFLAAAASLVCLGSLATPAPAQDCTGGTWTSISPVNTGRSRTGVAFDSVTGHFFMAGGEATGGNRDIPIEEYNPGNNTWTNRATLLTGVSNSGVAAAGGYVYVPGGWNGTVGIPDLQRFDPGTNNVVTLAPLPAGNAAHAVALRGGFIHVVGGSGTGATGTTHYIYDIGANNWTTGAALPTAVQYPAAVSDGALVYVLGGNTTNLTTVQVYDPGTNSWSPGPAMNVGRGGPGAFFAGGRVWAVGGGWASYLTSTESLSGGSWTNGPSLNTGGRTIGVGFGNLLAVKAAGWNGSYLTAAEALTCVAADTDLSIEKISDAAGPVLPGDTVTYTLTVMNEGPADATGVVVTDTLPLGLTYVSDDCGALDVPPWTWDIGNLANGANVQCNVTVSVDVDAAGDILNTADVTADNADPATGNNSSSTQITVGLGAPPFAEVPTLSQAGLLALLVLMAGVALLRLRR